MGETRNNSSKQNKRRNRGENTNLKENLTRFLWLSFRQLARLLKTSENRFIQNTMFNGRARETSKFKFWRRARLASSIFMAIKMFMVFISSAMEM